MRRTRKYTIASALIALLAVGAGGLWFLRSADEAPLKWRLRLLALKSTGSLDEVGWKQAFGLLSSGDAIMDADRFAQTKTLYQSIRNNRTTAHDIESGGRLFRAQCGNCHGADGQGGSGPDLRQGAFRRGVSDWALFQTISSGIPGVGMPRLAEPESSIWQVVAFVNSLRPGLAGASSTRYPEPAVGYARLMKAEQESGNWLTYSGSYSSQRHSRLAQINRDNASTLQLKWVAQMATSATQVKATPLVVGGIMYVTEPPNNVLAIDAGTGKQLWSYRRGLVAEPTLCCGAVNRGLAALNNMLYMATVDAHLIALDATTGKLVWDVQIADAREGYSTTGAPLAVKDKIITGVAGGEFGIRGFLDAYDAKSGKRMWRFYTIPGPGEPGHETWTADSWKTGGGPTWLTGSFDPGLNLVYWGVGNPGPVFQRDVRPGANLYSNSVIALDADTGTLKWHFQFTPHDDHDWDAVQIPVLVDATYEGRMRKLLLWANRNAFYYVLDRETGAFLRARAFARQTWAEGIGPDGAPIPKPGAEITPRGTLLWPGVLGATNWWSPAYDPRSGLFFVAALEAADVFFKKDSVTHVPGQYFGGSAHHAAPGVASAYVVRALRGDTGELAWEYTFPTPAKNSMGGILSTAGDLIFVGNDDQFTVLDSTTGAELWTLNAGGEILAAPVTYLVDGQQQVTVAAGRALFTFGLERPKTTPVGARPPQADVSSNRTTTAPRLLSGNDGRGRTSRAD